LLTIARLGVTTIIPGLLPAGIAGPLARMSDSAFRISTPADRVPAETLFEMKARLVMPVVPVLGA
jgi:hypothetical protein